MANNCRLVGRITRWWWQFNMQWYKNIFGKWLSTIICRLIVLGSQRGRDRSRCDRWIVNSEIGQNHTWCDFLTAHGIVGTIQLLLFPGWLLWLMTWPIWVGARWWTSLVDFGQNDCKIICLCACQPLWWQHTADINGISSISMSNSSPSYSCVTSFV